MFKMSREIVRKNSFHRLTKIIKISSSKILQGELDLDPPIHLCTVPLRFQKTFNSYGFHMTSNLKLQHR